MLREIESQKCLIWVDQRIERELKMELCSQLLLCNILSMYQLKWSVSHPVILILPLGKHSNAIFFFHDVSFEPVSPPNLVLLLKRKRQKTHDKHFYWAGKISKVSLPMFIQIYWYYLAVISVYDWNTGTKSIGTKGILGLLSQKDLLQKEPGMQKQCAMLLKLSCACKSPADVVKMQVWVGSEILYFPQLSEDVSDAA